MNKFLQGAIFELRKGGAIIMGTSKVAPQPMVQHLHAAAPNHLGSTIGLKGTQSQLKSPVASKR